jgi:hypothetical protein
MHLQQLTVAPERDAAIIYYRARIQNRILRAFVELAPKILGHRVSHTPLLDDVPDLLLGKLDTVCLTHPGERANTTLITERELGDLADLSLVLGNGIVVYAVYLGRVHLVRIASFTVDVKSCFLPSQPRKHTTFDAAEVGTYKQDEDYWFWEQRGCDMLGVALAEWPDDYTVKSVAEAFSVNVPGLSKPLVGEFDLVVTDGGDETISDWKTASMKWPTSKVDRDLQATTFCYAYQQKHGVNPMFRFDVFTKAKNPAHHQFYTLRTDDDFDRFVYLAGKIEKAVNTGIFLPVESCMNCAECAYGSRCKAAHRRAA